MLISNLERVFCLKKVMSNIAILDQIDSTNFTTVKQIYKPSVDHSGFITTLKLKIDLKSISSAEFPYIPDETPPDVLEQIFQELEATLTFKELHILLKKGSGAWVQRAKIRIFNKEPYYEVNLMPYFSDANTIDVAEDLSLGIQLKPGDTLAGTIDTIGIFGTVVEEKKNNGNEELAARIEILESLFGIFGAPSVNLPGSNGLVPGPPAGGGEFLLRGDRQWENPSKFATPAQITAAINALDFVDLTKNQTIGGAKTFTSSLTLRGDVGILNLWGNTDNYNTFRFTGNINTSSSYWDIGIGPSSLNRDFYISSGYAGGGLGFAINAVNYKVTMAGALAVNSSAQAISLNSAAFTVVGGAAIGGNIITALPTSAAGLPSGSLWRNGNVVNVV